MVQSVRFFAARDLNLKNRAKKDEKSREKDFFFHPLCTFPACHSAPHVATVERSAGYKSVLGIHVHAQCQLLHMFHLCINSELGTFGIF